MYTLSQITWMTLWGLSLLFVGGFVLWVYGAQKQPPTTDVFIQQGDVSRRFHAHLVRWFLLYGSLAIFAGIGCLLTAIVLML
jgi:hypothetical protein